MHHHCPPTQMGEWGVMPPHCHCSNAPLLEWVLLMTLDSRLKLTR